MERTARAGSRLNVSANPPPPFNLGVRKYLMKIIVCTKQIRHTYTRTGKNPEKNYINPEDSICRINPYDEAALELALRLKDALGEGEIILLTIGPMIAEAELRRCLAAGADLLYQIETSQGETPEEPLNQPDLWVKSDMLSRAAKELEGDIILCGKESSDRGNGQVGALLAHHLSLPFVSAISHLAFNAKNGKVQVQRSAGRGVRETVECILPAVFSADTGTDLRLPLVENKKRAGEYNIRRLNYDQNIPAPKIVTSHTYSPRPRPKIVPPPDSSLNAYKRVLQLLAGSTMEKKGEILTGSPESQVQGIISFLKKYSFLESENIK